MEIIVEPRHKNTGNIHDILLCDLLKSSNDVDFQKVSIAVTQDAIHLTWNKNWAVRSLSFNGHYCLSLNIDKNELLMLFYEAFKNVNVQELLDGLASYRIASDGK